MSTYTPILTKIEEAISESIMGMSISGGYYFDWGTVNETDIAKQEFPSAEIFVDEEECQDETNGIGARSYTQHANMLIRVRVQLDNEESNPQYSINKELNKALDDLKRLFGIHYTQSDSCETIMYRGMTRYIDKSNDILRPKWMDTRWLIKYIQDRQRTDLFSN